MTATIPLFGVVSTVLFVLFPGWGIKQILGRFGMQWRDDQASSLLASFALGIHLNAIVFMACWVFVGSSHVAEIGKAAIGLNLLVGLSGIPFRKALTPVRNSLLILIVSGIVVGEFAAYQFPNVLDSIQILQVQQYLLGWDGGAVNYTGLWERLHHFLLGGLALPTQPGFAGLVFIPSLFQTDLPVATVSSGLKVVLFALAAIVSDHAAKRFGFSARILAASLIFANMMLSQLGLHGLFDQGKDSVFAVLMVLASVSATGLDDEANEPGLFMAAAVLLGAVAVPYLMVFWFIYLAASFGATVKSALRQAAWCVGPLVVVVVGVHSASAGGVGTGGLLLPVIAGVMLLAIIAWAVRRLGMARFESSTRWLWVMAFVPLICVVGIVLLLPARASILTGYAGSVPIYQSFAPLDGLTTARGYFYEICPMNNAWLTTFALFACVILPLAFEKYRSPFFIALLSFLPATAFIALLHLRLHLHLLSDFNLWDLTKDTVQWYVGAFSAIIALLGAHAVSDRVRPRLTFAAVPVMCAIFVVGLSLNYPHFAWLLQQPKTVTSSGGYLNDVSAKAMDYLWRHARGNRLFVTRNSQLGEHYPAYPMFGGREMSFFSDAALVPSDRKATYLTNAADARRVIRFARQQRATIGVVGLDEDAYIVDVAFDGANVLTADHLPKVTVSLLDGAYAIENAQGRTFRWIGSTTKMVVVSMSDETADFCTELKLINPFADHSAAMKIVTSAAETTVAVPFDATFAAPFQTRVCAPLVNGTATIELRSAQPSRRFPNSADMRSISFGLVWPVVPE